MEENNKKYLRTCRACRCKKNKFESDFLRVSYNEDLKKFDVIVFNKAINPSGKSFYCCNNKDCIKKAIGKKLLPNYYKLGVEELDNPKLYEDFEKYM